MKDGERASDRREAIAIYFHRAIRVINSFITRRRFTDTPSGYRPIRRKANIKARGQLCVIDDAITFQMERRVYIIDRYRCDTIITVGKIGRSLSLSLALGKSCASIGFFLFFMFPRFSFRRTVSHRIRCEREMLFSCKL